MKRIPLSATRGEPSAYAIVDDEDFALVGHFNWADGRPYAKRFADGKCVYLHRVLMGLEPGDGLTVDHINGDKYDNRRANLRVCTKGENLQNQGSRPGSTSRYRGVYFQKSRKKWMARVKVNYRHHYLGMFDDELEAARAAEAFRRERLPFAVPDPALEEEAA